MTLYCGIDLHSNDSVVSLIDEADQLISKKRLDNDLEAITDPLKGPTKGDATNGTALSAKV